MRSVMRWRPLIMRRSSPAASPTEGSRISTASTLVHAGHVVLSPSRRHTASGGASAIAPAWSCCCPMVILRSSCVPDGTAFVFQMEHLMGAGRYGGGVAEPSPRERILQRIVAHVLAHGLGDESLREVAAAVGTSHRMLGYHFGSRDGLLT